ncbi:MAG: hypothetical protein WA821_17800 [Anaerolineales bacterium]
MHGSSPELGAEGRKGNGPFDAHKRDARQKAGVFPESDFCFDGLTCPGARSGGGLGLAHFARQFRSDKVS